MKSDKTAYAGGLTQKKDLTDDEIAELQAQVQKAYESLTLTTNYEQTAEDADLIIEAIAEDPEQKIAF